MRWKQAVGAEPKPNSIRYIFLIELISDLVLARIRTITKNHAVMLYDS